MTFVIVHILPVGRKVELIYPLPAGLDEEVLHVCELELDTTQVAHAREQHGRLVAHVERVLARVPERSQRVEQLATVVFLSCCRLVECHRAERVIESCKVGFVERELGQAPLKAPPLLRATHLRELDSIGIVRAADAQALHVGAPEHDRAEAAGRGQVDIVAKFDTLKVSKQWARRVARAVQIAWLVVVVVVSVVVFSCLGQLDTAVKQAHPRLTYDEKAGGALSHERKRIGGELEAGHVGQLERVVVDEQSAQCTHVEILVVEEDGLRRLERNASDACDIERV